MLLRFSTGLAGCRQGPGCALAACSRIGLSGLGKRVVSAAATSAPTPEVRCVVHFVATRGKLACWQEHS